MKIEAIRDFGRPRAAVAQNLRDPRRFEKILRDLGMTVEGTAPPPQMMWHCRVVWRGEPRPLTVSATQTLPDEKVTIAIDSDLAGAEMTLDLRDLPDGGCRIVAHAEVTAHTMMARLALQSLRLVRGRAEKRLAGFVFALGRK